MQRFIVLFLLAAFLSGCASMDERKKTVLLDRATRHYESAIRWGDYATANAYRLQESADALATNPVNLKQFRVTSYETLNTVLNEDETEAHVVVQIRYYDEERMKEMTLTDRQTWKYDIELGLWHLDSPLPAFR
jgi:ABC-type metal ion transport system substrate-binding protein